MNEQLKIELTKFQEKHKQFFEDNKMVIWNYLNISSIPPSVMTNEFKKHPFTEEMLFEFNNIITTDR
jgi:hypothetical protein